MRAIETTGYKDAKIKYVSQSNKSAANGGGISSQTPREQLNEFKKRNRPAVILKMKSVNASSTQGQPNILSKAQMPEQSYGQRGSSTR